MTIPAGSDWDWPDSNWKRRKRTVSDRIFWSYAWLIATRIVQEKQLPPGARKRNHIAVPDFYRLCRGEKTIRSLERDLFQSMLSGPCCLHCGSIERLTKDHLIPRSRGGDGDAENIITCCAKCNSSRGNTDLMHWYRKNQSFPCLVLMRQYLKICFKYATSMDLMDVEVDEAIRRGLPFDPVALPEKYPALENLIYDWRDCYN
ncbi:HNH endonuclease [Gemmobacter lutimaris]|uniref:HNH endonuclease n=1 Tax=Gemmobacter lutimaris TaxID=2306023 RepID=A0A398C389_9RHOB|nr:HNH endonuclease [Gemmobacter lutimaris]RID93703.1 HNH endonuclease [Gemmobacter lutimaris]